MDFEQLANDMVELWRAMVTDDEARDEEILSTEPDEQEPEPVAAESAPVSEEPDQEAPVPQDSEAETTETEPAPVEQDLDVSSQDQEEEALPEAYADSNTPEDPPVEDNPPEEIPDATPDTDEPQLPPEDPVEDLEVNFVDEDAPELSVDTGDLPDDPVDSLDENAIPEDGKITADNVRFVDQQIQDIEFDDMPYEAGVVDDPFPELSQPSNSGRQKTPQVEVHMPDGWQAQLSQTISQRMSETQLAVSTYVDDEISRSAYHLDMLGGD